MTGMGMLRRQSGHPEIATPMTRPDDADGLAARRLAFERLTDQRLLRAYRLATLVMRDSSAGSGPRWARCSSFSFCIRSSWRR